MQVENPTLFVAYKGRQTDRQRDTQTDRHTHTHTHTHTHQYLYPTKPTRPLTLMKRNEAAS